MDHYDIISASFQATMQSIAMSVDELAGPLGRAGDLMSSALLQDRKVLCCGEGADAALAMLFTSNLLGRFDRDQRRFPRCSPPRPPEPGTFVPTRCRWPAEPARSG